MGIAAKLNRLVNGDIVLLCEIPVADDEYDELTDYTYEMITERRRWDTNTTDLMLSLFLVQTAIRKYSVGFWDKVFETLKMQQRMDLQITFGKIFLFTIRQYGMFELRNNTDHNLYVENIKAHAFIPNEYMKGYYDFLYKFYKYNLLCQLGEDLDDDIDGMVNYLADTLQGKDKGNDDIRTQVRSYGLLNATKFVLAEAESGYVHTLISNNLHMIDNFYYEGIVQDENNRFAAGFVKWSEDYNKDHSKQGIQKIRHFREDIRSSNPILKFDTFSFESYIIIRQQKIRERDYLGSAKAEIYIGNKRYEVDLDPYYSAGVYLSDDKTVEVEGILRSITIQIVTGLSTVVRTYEIKPQDYQLFDKNGYQISEITNWNDLHLFAKKDSIVKFSNISLAYPPDQDLSDEWDHYAFENLKHDSLISVNGKYIQPKNHLDELVKYTAMSQLKCRAYYNDKLLECDVAHPLVMFSLINDVINESHLVIESAGDEFDFPLSSNVIQKVPKDANKTLCGVWIDKLMEVIPGRYTIKLHEENQKPRVLADYILLPPITIKTDKPFYELDKKVIITVNSELELKPQNCKGEDNRYVMNLEEDHQYPRFDFELDGDQYVLEIPLLMISYSYNGTWYYSRGKTIWKEDIWRKIYVKIPGAIKANIFVKSKERHPYYIHGEVGDRSLFKFSRAELEKELDKTISVRNTILLNYCLADNEWKTIELFSVLERVILTDVSLYTIDGKESFIRVNYEGKNHINARIKRQNDNYVLSDTLIIGDTASLGELELNVPYNIDLYEISRTNGKLIEKIDTEKEVYVEYKNDVRGMKVRINLIHNGKRTLYPTNYTELINFQNSNGRYICDLIQKTTSNSKKVLSVIKNVIVSMDFEADESNLINNIYVDSGDEAEFLYFDMKNRIIVSGDSELVRNTRDYSRFEMIDMEGGTRIDYLIDKH